ncbi:MAG: hypothetical protein V3S89_05495 [Desulfobacterales bacterium]
MDNADTIVPIYFPFTTISPSVGAMLHTCFNRSVVYALSEGKTDSLLQQGAEAGWLDIRTPVGVDPEVLGSVLDRYRSWSDQHRKEGRAHLKTPVYPSLPEDRAIAGIIGAIRGNQSPPSQAEGKAPQDVDRRMQAGLFLHAAEIFDTQKSGMSDNLRNVKRMEADLISDLREDDDSVYGEMLGHGMVADDDTGHYMVAERILSWARLMADDPALSGLFITSSPTVLATLLDEIPDAQRVLELGPLESLCPSEKLPAAATEWQSCLSDCLDSLLKGLGPVAIDTPGLLPGQDSGNPLFSLAIYMIPGQGPRMFLEKLAGVYAGQAAEAIDLNEPENTLIGLLTSVQSV